MFARIYGASLSGLDALPVEVEVRLTKGLPGVTIVGLPTNEVKESKDRLRAVFAQCHLPFPKQKVTINLVPGDRKKVGTSLDLPMAVALLKAQEILPNHPYWDRALYYGELDLEGRIRKSPGSLSVANLCIDFEVVSGLVLGEKGRQILHPLADKCSMTSINHLTDLVSLWKAGAQPDFITTQEDSEYSWMYPELFASVQDQEIPKRAMCISIAGGHNLFFAGPPGSGKSMLAKAAREMLPPMTLDEKLDVARILDIGGELDDKLPHHRPYRSPHHTISPAALIGGGQPVRPGEITLSHNGILFLDEFLEFRRDALEGMRQPLEDKKVEVSRVASKTRWPADSIIVAATNMCPCAKLGDPRQSCRCSNEIISRYQRRMSQALLERFDVQVNVAPVSLKKIHLGAPKEAAIVDAKKQQETIQQTREIQYKRQNRLNSSLSGTSDFLVLEKNLENWLTDSLQRLGLSARQMIRMVKVARTIADMAQSIHIQKEHLMEAMSYRIVGWVGHS